VLHLFTDIFRIHYRPDETSNEHKSNPKMTASTCCVILEHGFNGRKYWLTRWDAFASQKFSTVGAKAKERCHKLEDEYATAFPGRRDD
jgi:hypothetical protein